MKKLILFILVLLIFTQENSQSQETPKRDIPNLVITNDSQKIAKVGLQKLNIQVDVFGNIAKTTMTMTFKNDENRDLEGTLTFPMPEGISVTGYAIDINGKMRNAVPVDKSKGTEVFESIENRRVDPGLLERVEGNNFKTRIYPLPAKGQRTISITYEENLKFSTKSGFQYYLPLAYKKAIEKFDLQVQVFQSNKKPTFISNPDGSLSFSEDNHIYQANLAKTNFVPQESLVISLPKKANANENLTQLNTDNSFYFLTNVFIENEKRPKVWNDKIGIIWDNSLSAKDRNLEKELELLNQIIQQKRNLTIDLGLLNINFTKAKTFAITNGNWSELKNYLKTITYDGGTDYSKLNEQILNADEYLFFSEGLSTFGKNEVNLRKPVYTISSSAIADYSTLKSISAKTGAKYINLLNNDVTDALKQLSTEGLQFLGIKEAGNYSEVYPAIHSEVNDHIAIAGIGKDKNQKQMTLLFGFGNQISKEIKVTINYQKNDINIHQIWAQKKIAELDIDYDRHKKEIEELGKEFNIVTRNTSLIVLESVADYVRYDITPPSELAAEYNQIKKQNRELKEERIHDLLEQSFTMTNELKSWWNTKFEIKTKYPKPHKKNNSQAVEDSVLEEVAMVGSPQVVRNTQNLERRAPVASSPQAKEASYSEATSESLKDVSTASISNLLEGKVAGINVTVTGVNTRDKNIAKIEIPEIKSDKDYIKKIESSQNPYLTYLDLRKDYLGTPTYYFDVANYFYRKGNQEKAVLILSSLADLQIENADLYKTLAYTLKQWKEYKRELFVTEKILKWRPMDPQSHRDFALALQDNGDYQKALDELYSILTQSYSPESADRDDGIEETIIMEINNLIGLQSGKINKNKVNSKLIANLPVDIRVVMNWNSRNTDIDLWVTDPRGEKCFYSNKSTEIGGRLSNDFTRCYGPEQFLLKKAIKGNYKIEVDFYNDSELTLAGPAAVMAEIFLYYNSGHQDRKIITLYLDKVEDRDVMIGEFTF